MGVQEAAGLVEKSPLGGALMPQCIRGFPGWVETKSITLARLRRLSCFRLKRLSIFRAVIILSLAKFSNHSKNAPFSDHAGSL